MNEVIFSFVLIFISLVADTRSAEIDETVTEYFSSDNVRSFRELWNKHKKAYERSLMAVLQESYDGRGMNIFMKKSPNAYVISDAFYSSENGVDVIFKDLYLIEVPKLMMPEISLDLPSNFLCLDVILDKIVVDAKYDLFRSGNTLNPTDALHSPFNSIDVLESGRVSIVAEQCRLSGVTIVTLGGHTVNLGHDTFALKDCELHVEIYKSVPFARPTIAPYFSKEESVHILRLLARPLREELVNKVQGGLFSQANTSAIFGDDIAKFRIEQSRVFEDTTSYLRYVVANLNEETLSRGKNTVSLKEKKIEWTEKVGRNTEYLEIRLWNMVIYGLDTAYLAHDGGPYFLSTVKIADSIRFSTLQVRGKIDVFLAKNNTKKGVDFVAEFRDVSVDFEINMEDKTLQNVEMRYWRALDLNHYPTNPLDSRALIIGYLIKEVPYAVVQHVSKMTLDVESRKDKFLLEEANDSSAEALADENDTPLKEADSAEDNVADNNKDELLSDKEAENSETTQRRIFLTMRLPTGSNDNEPTKEITFKRNNPQYSNGKSDKFKRNRVQPFRRQGIRENHIVSD